MIKNVIQRLKTILTYIKNNNGKSSYEPLYRLVEIREDEGEYMVLIQVINKNLTFGAKPEEILANDALVDQFSPRDVRSLTYLGYLGVNSPKYKILAQKLSKNDKTIFVLKKKGEKEVVLKTADQIIQETGLILSMHPQDAKVIGYTVAAESGVEEKKQKEALLEAGYLKGRQPLEDKSGNSNNKEVRGE